MIHLYAYNTPNSYKVSIALEELACEYVLHPINVRKGEQLSDEFRALNPNAKVPIIRDEESDLVLSESNAILTYLAAKTDKLMPSGIRRYQATQWLYFQAAAVGPVLGELGHYMVLAKEKLPYAIDRYRSEMRRLCDLLEKQLEAQPYLCGEFSMVDIAHFGWLHFVQEMGISFQEWAGIGKWLERIRMRPAVERGLKVLVPVH